MVADSPQGRDLAACGQARPHSVRLAEACGGDASRISTGLPPAASRRGDSRRLYADGVTNELDPTALRCARLAKGLTQKQLSETIGVAVEGRVSTWERGRATPHPQQLRALADALGVSIKSMLRPVAVQQYNLRRLRIEAGLNIEELVAQADVGDAGRVHLGRHEGQVRDPQLVQRRRGEAVPSLDQGVWALLVQAGTS